MNRHINRRQSKGRLNKKQFQCNHCDFSFIDYEGLIRHVEETHPLNREQTGGKLLGKGKTEGTGRQKRTTTRQVTQAEMQNKHKTVQNRRYSEESALNDAVQNRILYPENDEIYDLLLFFANSKVTVQEFLRSKLEKHGIKWYLSTQVEMYRETPDGTIYTDMPHFRSLTYATLSVETISEHEINEAFQKMSASLESYLRNSSGWNIRKVIHMRIHTVMYKPLAGSSFIELPLSLKKTSSVLNIQNDDNKCFLWSILAALKPCDSHPENFKNYVAFERDLNMNGIEYPVPLTKIERFERQNACVSVNVFAFDSNEIIPLRITKHNGRDHHADLLLLTSQQTSHYCLIKDLNRFLSRTKRRKCKTFFCPYCLHGFVSEKGLHNHKPYCSIHGPQKVELPTSGQNDMLEFSDYEKQLKIPFVIYADFECLSVKVQSSSVNPQQSSTSTSSLLQPISFGYKVVCQNPKYTKPTVIYRGIDASQKLIECLIDEKKQIDTILENIEPLRMDEKDEETFKNATHCCICHKAFGPNDVKVRHHQHFFIPDREISAKNKNVSNFIGPSHNRCNLLAKKATFVPCVFHNLKHFDGHILMQSLGLFKENKITCIPSDIQNYISFSLDNLRFIDSLQFLNSSLESLVENLACDNENSFQSFQEEFSHEQSRLLLRKGIFPYEYIDDIKRFEETELPPIEAFYSQIKNESVSQSEYAHALNVFKIFELKNLGEYHDLYLKTDVVLLCDVFEQFRNMCLAQYDLDPCHYYTSPGLSWSACLKKSSVCLELLCDIDQLNFIERGMRGGISQISHRYQKANNPLLDENLDSSQPISYIQYLDMNNLYGYAMTQKLPTGMFRFLNEDEIERLDILSIPEEGSVGMILEVSLIYPNEIHDRDADYPLAPEKRRITDEELSPYAKRLWKKLNGQKEDDKLPPRSSVEKLITSLDDKNNYVLHYRNLQLYLRLGMKIKRIHRVLEFHQEAWMKPYIDFNTEQRKKSKSAFQKNFYKLMNCSVFGESKFINLYMFKSLK
ncbi:MAG: DNA polymerase [Candidatus Thiodiazotropha endolucinida]|nr:DNA polymerase [Candidatus Thiodiazotropha taylori]MCW4262113.1 DNA polymerase [Candidatus Thiodiazotropha endolucinida]